MYTNAIESWGSVVISQEKYETLSDEGDIIINKIPLTKKGQIVWIDFQLIKKKVQLRY